MSKIILELKSDLCAGTGAGFSSFVDTDICYDQYGLPYIPGRRIKGCLREAAEYIDQDNDELNELFGIPGSDKPGVLKISNGYLTQITPEIKKYIKQNKIPPSQVLDIFTHVHASTAVDESTGTAKQESLRFIRVLNQNKPGTNESLVFEFACEDDGSESTKKTMTRVCQALRNIGTNRTRGLGAVKCQYIFEENHKSDLSITELSEKTKTLVVNLETLDPLLITATSDDECNTYISGTTILGALASLYLKGKTDIDEVFNDLFLRQKVTYSNFYISGSSNKTECIPAPYLIRKIKSSDPRIDGKVFTFFNDKKAFIKSYIKDNENNLDNITRLAQEKPLRGKMIEFAPGKAIEHNVLTERVYHHSVHDKDRKTGPEADTTLYTQTCICAGQHFKGTITGPGNLLKVIEELLNTYDLRLGKSRSAQYSRCKAKAQYEDDKKNETSLSVKTKEKLVIVLESDAIPKDHSDSITSLVSDLVPCLTKEDFVIDYQHTALDYRSIHGYNAKRGLRNIPLRALMMGSTITLELKKDMTFIKYKQLIGRKTAEGFGRVHLYNSNEFGEITYGEASANESTQDVVTLPDWFMSALKKENSSVAVQQGYELYAKIKLKLTGKDSSSSLIGRLILMTNEADDPAKMRKMIESIKKDAKRDAVLGAFDTVMEAKINTSDTEKAIKTSGYWKECWLTVLRLAKYDLKRSN